MSRNLSVQYMPLRKVAGRKARIVKNEQLNLPLTATFHANVILSVCDDPQNILILVMFDCGAAADTSKQNWANVKQRNAKRRWEKALKAYGLTAKPKPGFIADHSLDEFGGTGAVWHRMAQLFHP